MQRIIVRAAVPAAFLVASAATAGPVPVEVVLAEGDVVDGRVVTGLNGVGATPADTIGFNGTLADGDRFVWVGTGPAVFNSDFVEDVTGAEAPTGVSDAGNWIYSPSVDGNDSVILDDGLIVSETQPSFDGVPGFITFNSRPFMTAGGVGYWISGYNETDPDGPTQGRVLYRYDGSAVTAVTVAGDSFGYQGGTFTIDVGSGIDFDFDVSPGDVNRIQLVDAAGESPAGDNVVIINGEGVHREGDPTGDGDNWDNFDRFRILDDGTYVMTGDTDGDPSSDEFIAVDGSIVLREGMTVDGVTLTSGVTLRGIDLLPDGTLVHGWGSTSFGEAVFVGDIGDLAGTSVRVIGTGDVVDLGALGTGTVDDLEASTVLPGGIAVSGAAVYVNLDITPDGGGGNFEIIARLPLAGDSCPEDVDGNGTVDFDDVLAVLNAFGTGDPGADVDGNGTVEFADLLAVLNAFGPCP